MPSKRPTHWAPAGMAKCRECGKLWEHTATGRKPQWCDEHKAMGRATDARNKKRSEVASRYGITLEQYRAVMDDAECAICGTVTDLVYDHDHDTMQFRGVLCRLHNAAIGQLGDSAAGVWKAFEYIIGVPTRPDWDAYGMMLAQAVAVRADCRRSKVGSVLMDPEHRIVSTGYNGVLPEQRGCLDGACPRGLKSYSETLKGESYDDCISTHSEANALKWWLGTWCPNHTLYVTRAPCGDCETIIRQYGNPRVVHP